jgi:hypothetical protein
VTRARSPLAADLRHAISTAPARVEPRWGRRSRGWCAAAAALGVIAGIGSGAPFSAVGPALPGFTGPVDRTVVASPPIYPAAPAGFRRLPDGPSSPVGVTPAPALVGLGSVGRGAGPGLPGDRPVWRPARLEPVVGVDARGHVTSILEYSPGRFER